MPYSKTLKYGHEGAEVFQLQCDINKHFGKMIVKPDGVFGPETAEAVKKIQRAGGRGADGVAGPLFSCSMDLLLGRLKPLTPLKLGDKGNRVVFLQQALNVWGAKPKLNPTGVFDEATKEAVMKAQKYYGEKPNGIADTDFVLDLGSVELFNKLK